MYCSVHRMQIMDHNVCTPPKVDASNAQVHRVKVLDRLNGMLRSAANDVHPLFKR